jgi:hypothetical protein
MVAYSVLDCNAAVPVSNLAPPQTMANSIKFLCGLPPGMAQFRGLAFEGTAEVKKDKILKKYIGKK